MSRAPNIRTVLEVTLYMHTMLVSFFIAFFFPFSLLREIKKMHTEHGDCGGDPRHILVKCLGPSLVFVLRRVVKRSLGYFHGLERLNFQSYRCLLNLIGASYVIRDIRLVSPPTLGHFFTSDGSWSTVQCMFGILLCLGGLDDEKGWYSHCYHPYLSLSLLCVTHCVTSSETSLRWQETGFIWISFIAVIGFFYFHSFRQLKVA